MAYEAAAAVALRGEVEEGTVVVRCGILRMILRMVLRLSKTPAPFVGEEMKGVHAW
jgi:hypothetical protein